MRAHIQLGSLLAILFAALAAAADPAIRVVTGADGKPIAVEALGLSPETLAALAKLPGDDGEKYPLLQLYLFDATRGTQLPAMAGQYEVKGDALRFTPRFPLRPGLTYLADFFPPPKRPQDSPARLEKKFTVPAPPPKDPTKVTAIYPSAAVLPENQLRFYLHFSAPMRLGDSYSYIQLIGEDGKPDKHAFLEIGEELWDGSGQRLTLLFHPGRTKRGLQPREEFGPVLVPGRKYTLAIDKTWLDADGRPLAAGFEKRFTAGPMIEVRLDEKQWKLAPPKAGGKEPLVVRFPHSLDRALLDWTIVVQDAAKKPIAGDVAVADDERRWEFRPEQPWAAGQFTLVIDTRLEDTAGNSLAHAFEVDVFGTAARELAPEFVRMPFEIK
jgi:hypothetical protein